MPTTDAAAVIRFLNRLRRRHLIPPYVVVGGVAAVAYGIPRATKDIDILIPVDDLIVEDARIWSVIFKESGGQSQEQTIYVPAADTLLDIMPTGKRPFWEEALREAREVRVEGMKVRWVTLEHLLFMALESFRPDPDYSRIGALYPQADKRKLRTLLEKYDDAEGTYAKRLKRIVGE